MGWTRHWHRHPDVRSGEQLTSGEHYADLMRNGMGSWPFVFGFLGAMFLWGVANSVFHLFGSNGRHGFDPYPYILLNLILSTLAGLQGAILLIAAKRADQISSELAASDYEVNVKAEKLIEENTALTRAVKELTETIHAHILGNGSTGAAP